MKKFPDKRSSSESHVTAQKTLTTRGLKTAWLEAGSPKNDILLLLHGFPDDAHVWDEQIQHFRNHFHVVAPMMRGAGLSEPSRDQSRYGLSATALDQLVILRKIDPAGRKKIYLVGHDLGTLHAWHLAPLLGKRLKGLVILNGGHPLQVWGRKTNTRQLMKSWYVYLFLLPLMPELLLKTVGKPILKRVKKWGGIPENKMGSAAEALNYAANTVKQYLEIAKSLPKYWWYANRFKLDAPTLAISTTGDAFVEPTTLKELNLIAKKPSVRIIEGKHWIQCENPDRINKLMDKFFREDCR